MSTLPDFDDERDTGRIATIAADEPSDPMREIRRLRVQVGTHELLNGRRWRQLMAAIAFVGAAAGGVATAAWTAHAEAAADRARLEDVQQRLVRIEAQIDRLMERSEER